MRSQNWNTAVADFDAALRLEPNNDLYRSRLESAKARQLQSTADTLRQLDDRTRVSADRVGAEGPKIEALPSPVDSSVVDLRDVRAPRVDIEQLKPKIDSPVLPHDSFAPPTIDYTALPRLLDALARYHLMAEAATDPAIKAKYRELTTNFWKNLGSALHRGRVAEFADLHASSEALRDAMDRIEAWEVEASEAAQRRVDRQTADRLLELVRQVEPGTDLWQEMKTNVRLRGQMAALEAKIRGDEAQEVYAIEARARADLLEAAHQIITEGRLKWTPSRAPN